MSASVATFTPNAFPTGHADELNQRELFGTIAISGGGGTYPANGIPVSFASSQAYSANAPFWGDIQGFAGYIYRFDPTHQTVRIFQSAGFTPAGSIAVTEGAVTVKGGGIGEAIGINPDSNSGVLSKAAATDRTIPRATLLGSATTAALTGTAVAAGPLVEVATDATTPAAVLTDTILARVILHR